MLYRPEAKKPLENSFMRINSNTSNSLLRRERAKFGNANINAIATAQIQQLRQEIEDLQRREKEVEKEANGWQGGDNILQAGLLTLGGITAFFGAPLVAAACFTYPVFKNLVKVRSDFHKGT